MSFQDEATFNLKVARAPTRESAPARVAVFSCIQSTIYSGSASFILLRVIHIDYSITESTWPCFPHGQTLTWLWNDVFVLRALTYRPVFSPSSRKVNQASCLPQNRRLPQPTPGLALCSPAQLGRLRQ